MRFPSPLDLFNFWLNRIGYLAWNPGKLTWQAFSAIRPLHRRTWWPAFVLASQWFLREFDLSAFSAFLQASYYVASIISQHPSLSCIVYIIAMGLCSGYRLLFPLIGSFGLNLNDVQNDAIDFFRHFLSSKKSVPQSWTLCKYFKQET